MPNTEGITPQTNTPALPVSVNAILERAILKGRTGPAHLVLRLRNDRVPRDVALQAADEYTSRTGTPAATMAELFEKYYTKSLRSTDETSPDGDKCDAATKIRRLLDLRSDSGQLTLFHTPAGKPYISIKSPSDGSRNTYPVESVGFQGVLRELYGSVESVRLPPSQALKDVSAYALHKALAGATGEVYSRVANIDSILWVDLANERREVVKVTQDGCVVVRDCPVHFERPASMLPLPHPVGGGDLEGLLKPFLNVRDDDSGTDLKLALAWLLSTLQPDGAFPILQVCGGEGAAKTTFAKVLRLSIDPNGAPTQTFPSKVEDLILT